MTGTLALAGSGLLLVTPPRPARDRLAWLVGRRLPAAMTNGVQHRSRLSIRSSIIAASAVLGLVTGLAAGPVPGTLVLAIGAVAGWGRRQLSAERAVVDDRARLAELVASLMAEHAAGSTLGAALRQVADGAGRWQPAVLRSARLASVGADPARGLVQERMLVPLAVALALTGRTGAGVTEVLTRVRADVQAAQDCRRAVAEAVAGPRSSAVLLAVLPVIGIAMGCRPRGSAVACAHPDPDRTGGAHGGRAARPRRSGLDGPAHPMMFLLLAAGILLLPGPHRGRRRRHGSRPAGQRPGRTISLAAAGGLGAALVAVLLGGRIGWLLALPIAVATHHGVRRIASSRKVKIDRQATAFLLDLLSAALVTGLPVDAAIGAVEASVARYGDEALTGATEPFRLVGRLLVLGSDPARAWAELDSVDGLRAVAAAGRRCAHSGARLAGALTETATELRAQHRQQQLDRAQRTGVWALLPLGLCFLPAFVCLGVVPVVVGLAGQMFGRQLGFGGGSALQ